MDYMDNFGGLRISLFLFRAVLIFVFLSQLPRMFREVRARCHLSLYREAHYNYYHTSSGIKIADTNSATCTTAYKLLVPLQLSLYTRCLVPSLLEVQYIHIILHISTTVSCQL